MVQDNAFIITKKQDVSEKEKEAIFIYNDLEYKEGLGLKYYVNLEKRHEFR
jgi:hypothetical protein